MSWKVSSVPSVGVAIVTEANRSRNMMSSNMRESIVRYDLIVVGVNLRQCSGVGQEGERR
jgi:hypothetical protein